MQRKVNEWEAPREMELPETVFDLLFLFVFLSFPSISPTTVHMYWHNKNV